MILNIHIRKNFKIISNLKIIMDIGKKKKNNNNSKNYKKISNKKLKKLVKFNQYYRISICIYQNHN